MGEGCRAPAPLCRRRRSAEPAGRRPRSACPREVPPTSRRVGGARAPAPFFLAGREAAQRRARLRGRLSRTHLGTRRGPPGPGRRRRQPPAAARGPCGRAGLKGRAGEAPPVFSLRRPSGQAGSGRRARLVLPLPCRRRRARRPPAGSAPASRPAAVQLGGGPKAAAGPGRAAPPAPPRALTRRRGRRLESRAPSSFEGGLAGGGTGASLWCPLARLPRASEAGGVPAGPASHPCPALCSLTLLEFARLPTAGFALRLYSVTSIVQSWGTTHRPWRVRQCAEQCLAAL